MLSPTHDTGCRDFACLSVQASWQGECLANGKAVQRAHTAQNFAICLLCMSGVLALS